LNLKINSIINNKLQKEKLKMSISIETKSSDSILHMDDYDFVISNELADYIRESDSLNPETIEVSTSKTGVVTLKIKSLTYSINDKTKVLNLYKNSNSKEKFSMKTFIRFMKRNKGENDKPTKFESLILRTVKPVLKDVEFGSIDEVKSAVYDALKPYMTEESKWTIEDNTKTVGLVVKNEYKKANFDSPALNMFFINVAQVTEG